MVVNNGRYYLYKHIRLDNNEVFYIGIGTKGKRRPCEIYYRAYDKRGRNPIWHNIVNKAGYKVEIILETNDHAFILQKEIEFIKVYGRKNLGLGTLCNLTDGGEGATGKVLSPKQIEVIAARGRGRKVSKQTREKIRQSLVGRKASPDSIKKGVDKRSIAIVEYDMNKTFINKWKNSVEAGLFYNIDPSCIRKVCKKQVRFYKNRLWEYDK